MSPKEYAFIRNLVYDRSRINLGHDKQVLVSSRLGKRMKATQTSSISEYCKFLKAPGNNDEVGHLIDAISTNHTYFFREMAHFDFLRNHAIPELVGRGPFRVWSAASSSGEEAYSIAMTLDECINGSNWCIEATDISTRILTKATNAIYGDEVVKRIPLPLQIKYFRKGFGPQEGYYRVKDDLRAKVQFQYLNLLEGEPPFKDLFQVIFCRNVMIYFDNATQTELVNKLARYLVPGGYLFVGHSESLASVKHHLKVVKPAVYKRV